MNKKIVFTSKGLNILLKFLGIFIIFVSVLFIIGIGSGFMNVTDFELSQSPFTLFSSGYGTGTETAVTQIKEGYITLITGLTVNLVYAIMFFLASVVFEDISNGESPFTRLQVKRLKRLSWLFIGTFFIPIILQNILHWIMIPGRYYNISLDGTKLIAPILFYALAEIFSYGALLQREVDETL